MSNMSYSRFQMTLRDLEDCRDALRDTGSIHDIEDQEEQQAAVELLEVCREIVERYPSGNSFKD